MKRRSMLLLLSILPASLRAAETSVRGTLVQPAAGSPVIKTSDGRIIYPTGDADTLGVLKDQRLANTDFEAIGEMGGDGNLKINPIFKRALFVYKDGQRRMVTYWCDTCAIRTYTPGLCWCCREETKLDLISPDTVDKK